MSATTLSGLLAAAQDHGEVAFGRSGPSVATGELLEHGARRFGAGAPDAVAAILTNDRPSVEVVLGAIVAGVRLVSLPLPSRGADPSAYLGSVQRSCAALGVESVIARDDVAELLVQTGLTVVAHRDLDARRLAAPRPGGFELVQFSSGSTSRPKGIGLSDADLGANVSATIEAVAPRPGDVAVSWLPLSHDMGLIGMVLTSIASFGPQVIGGGRLVVLRPEDFLRAPGTWISALAEERATFTATPDFGLRMAVSRPVATASDLRPLRCAIVGGEIVRAETLAATVGALGGLGLDPAALCPAYGMAEAGLAVSMTPPAERWVEERVDPIALAERRRELPAEVPALTLVASGRPLSGYAVEGGAGSTIGELVVTAPAIGRDVLGDRSFAGADGRLRTGDLGYTTERGDVVVVGRADDYLVVNGRSLYAPAIERAVGRVAGVRPGRVTAVGDPTGAWIVAVEVAPGVGAADEARVRREVRRAAAREGGAAPDVVVVVERGALPLTSSGKLQRHEVLRRWVAGTLASAEPGVER